MQGLQVQRRWLQEEFTELLLQGMGNPGKSALLGLRAMHTKPNSSTVLHDGHQGTNGAVWAERKKEKCSLERTALPECSMQEDPERISRTKYGARRRCHSNYRLVHPGDNLKLLGHSTSAGTSLSNTSCNGSAMLRYCQTMNAFAGFRSLVRHAENMQGSCHCLMFAENSPTNPSKTSPRVISWLIRFQLTTVSQPATHTGSSESCEGGDKLQLGLHPSTVSQSQHSVRHGRLSGDCA